nr:MAG TPA: hypothetical protein [Caudoviricetes sp.]
MAILLHVPLNITSEKKNHSILPNKKKALQMKGLFLSQITFRNVFKTH